MITSKEAKDKVIAVKDATLEQLSHATTNEKIAGAAALGVVVGAAAGVIGSTLLHGEKDDKQLKSTKKPAA
jgi:hypothetical protein